MTSHPSRSYTLKISSARPTPCVPSTAIVPTLCVATMISRPRARAQFLISRCRRGRRSALPRRLRLRAKTFLLFVTSSLISLSLSPFLPLVLVSRRGFSCPTPRRLSHLPSPEQIWCLLTGSSPSSPWCQDRWYKRSDLWIQLTVHRQRHRLCRQLITARLDSLPSPHFHGLGPPWPGRQPG